VGQSNAKGKGVQPVVRLHEVLLLLSIESCYRVSEIQSWGEQFGAGLQEDAQSHWHICHPKDPGCRLTRCLIPLVALFALMFRFLVIISLTLIDWNQQRARYQADQQEQSFHFISRMHLVRPFLVESGNNHSSSSLTLNLQNQTDPQEKIPFFVFLARAFLHRGDHPDIADHACHGVRDGHNVDFFHHALVGGHFLNRFDRLLSSLVAVQLSYPVLLGPAKPRDNSGNNQFPLPVFLP
jgi:hypothetical protein